MKPTLTAIALAFSWVAAATAEDVARRIPDVVYSEPGGKPLLADVTIPPGDGPFPAVLVVHGGGWKSGGKTQMRFVADRLAANGYVAVAIAYRLAPDHKFPAQVDDCLTAVRWMRDKAADYKIDPRRIGAWGYSAGGHLVSMLGAIDSSAGFDAHAGAAGGDTRVQCVIAGGAPCDFRPIQPESEALLYWLGATKGQNAAVYERASPAVYVTSDDPPVYFYHGESDSTVEIDQPQAMERALRAAGVATEFHVVPGAEHIKAIFDREAAEGAIRFLDKHLKPAR